MVVQEIQEHHNTIDQTNQCLEMRERRSSVFLIRGVLLWICDNLTHSPYKEVPLITKRINQSKSEN